MYLRARCEDANGRGTCRRRVWLHRVDTRGKPSAIAVVERGRRAVMEGLVLGVDGGGSKTLVALADTSGQVIQLTRGAASNPLDQRGWQRTLTQQLEPFGGDRRIVAVAAGLPAYGEVEAISAEQRSAVGAVFGSTPQRVLNDVDAAHLGAFAGGPGILILSGTGSMAWARDAAGNSHRVGGWGDAIGDEGSSHWIGRRILSLVSKSLDG